MSVKFGRWTFDGWPIGPAYLEKVNALLAPYAPDGHTSHSAAGVSMLYHAFHTTKESRRETQPHVCGSGFVITWDGRLYNRAELIRDLGDVLTASSTDIEIVAAAYEEWHENCLAKLIGDWALSVWNATTRSLLLARDPIGTRHLYYELDESRVTWSTILDPLVLLAGRRFELCEEYVAGWLGFFPATHLTPYIGIDSVPPSWFVRLRPGKREIHKYWDFDPRKRIRYHLDAEYEEHFRSVFSEAVCRRLRSDSPILAELSGGMDSSSIVCMADEIIACGMAETPRLDTISYYDDSEPNWNERPYFAKVEEKRRRKGCHIDVSCEEPLKLQLEGVGFCPDPASVGLSRSGNLIGECLARQGNRVVLSGLGGDEVTGGVPTPVPELEDLIAQVRVRAFAHELKVWALDKKKPWFHLLFEATQGFLPPSLTARRGKRAPAWLQAAFVRRNSSALCGYKKRLKLIGPLPSFQENLKTLDGLRRQLGCCPATTGVIHEKRYPYLDRDLLAFLCGIPRGQLVRPGRRRSLMRRALAGIVPPEILERKRKGFVARWPLKAIGEQWSDVGKLTDHLADLGSGIVDATALSEAIQKARRGQKVPVPCLMRTVAVGAWLSAIRNFEAWPTGLQ